MGANIDGTRYEAEVVIGADGARSTVRRSVTPEHAEALYAGFLLWRAMVPESALPAEILPAGDEPSREHYFGAYRLVTYPVPGTDGQATRGRRRLNMVWYDPARSELLTSSGLLEGSTVHGSLAAVDVPSELREELSSRRPEDGRGRGQPPIVRSRSANSSVKWRSAAASS